MTHPEMSDERPLPEPNWFVDDFDETYRWPYYTAENMRAYLSEGTASLIAENERLRARLAEQGRESERRRENIVQLSTQLRACERERDSLAEFVRKVSKQTPEKPDHYTSCHQCESNASEADDLIDDLTPTPGEE